MKFSAVFLGVALLGGAQVARAGVGTGSDTLVAVATEQEQLLRDFARADPAEAAAILLKTVAKGDQALAVVMLREEDGVRKLAFHGRTPELADTLLKLDAPHQTIVLSQDYSLGIVLGGGVARQLTDMLDRMSSDQRAEILSAKKAVESLEARTVVGYLREMTPAQRARVLTPEAVDALNRGGERFEMQKLMPVKHHHPRKIPA